MKIVRMPIKKEWFDKLLSGEKTIEYRECKNYWTHRLGCLSFKSLSSGFMNHSATHILLINGYGKDSPKAMAKIDKIEYLRSGIDTDLKCEEPVYAIYLKNVILEGKYE